MCLINKEIMLTSAWLTCWKCTSLISCEKDLKATNKQSQISSEMDGIATSNPCPKMFALGLPHHSICTINVDDFPTSLQPQDFMVEKRFPRFLG